LDHEKQQDFIGSALVSGPVACGIFARNLEDYAALLSEYIGITTQIGQNLLQARR
jgi:hypothetical protein